MKNKMVLLGIILAVICLLVALIAKIFVVKIIFENPTWLGLAQTALLGAVAWGVGKLLPEKEN